LLIRILRAEMSADTLRARIEANLAAQSRLNCRRSIWVRGRSDITDAIARFVAAFLEAQFRPNPELQELPRL